ncbi:MAG: DUF2956 domain-containing protein [Methylococcaceae bacterium]|nr:DUF2956 domain-containing protein [Methylococcaceae bacterium]
MARRVQKPGQTKEQTRLIAQGIAKGIELYKRQQSAKARERDKARKRLEKARLMNAMDSGTEHGDVESDDFPPYAHPPATVLTVCGVLLLALAILHGVRLYTGWALVLGAWPVPLWISLLAAVLLSALAFWALLTAYHSR